jgi:hypothetical protein
MKTISLGLLPLCGIALSGGNPAIDPARPASIADKMRAPAREAKPAEPRPLPKAKPPAVPGDLRAIVTAGKENGLSGYEALLNSRWGKPRTGAFRH